MDEPLQVSVPDKTDRAQVEALVDEDLRRFDAWFQHILGDGALTKFEKAVLKTYLFYKIFGEEPAIQKAEGDLDAQAGS